MFFAFPKLFFRSKSNNEKGGKKAKFTRLDERHQLHAFLFKRIYFIRILKMKWDKKLRIS